MKQRIISINQKSHGMAIPLLLLPLWGLLYIELQTIADFITFNVLNLPSGTHLTETIRFFLFEVPKVMMLLILIIFGVGILRSYITPEKTKKILENHALFSGNIIAAVLGIITPFCSCSAIPLFLGFVEAGIPLGVTFSFLIAAPMINEVALVLLISLFGVKVALIYLFTGLIIAIIAGWVLQKLKLEKYVEPWVFQIKAQHTTTIEENNSIEYRIKMGYEAVRDIVGKIWIYVVLGVAIGAGAHGYVPEDLLATVLGKDNWYGVPLAILLGVPMYSNAAGIIPIVSVLIEKGVSLGTALSFMMSVIALSLPEIIILKKVLRWQLIAIFVGVVTVGIIIVGITFNYIL